MRDSDEIDYTIRVTKDAPDANWYIRVYHADGCAMYDGWWQRSDGKTVSEAVQEALRGACIAAQPTPLEGWKKAVDLAATVLTARAYKISIPSHEAESLARAILAMESSSASGESK